MSALGGPSGSPVLPVVPALAVPTLVIGLVALPISSPAPVPAAAAAQQAGAAARDTVDRRRAALARLEAGDRVRLDLDTTSVRFRTPLVADFLGVEESRVLFRPEPAADDTEAGAAVRGGDVAEIPASAISGLSTRGDAAGTGALVGGAIGVAFGVFAGQALDYVCAESGCSSWELIGVMAPLFGAAGAGSGALVGLAIPTWDRRFP